MSTISKQVGSNLNIMLNRSFVPASAEAFEEAYNATFEVAREWAEEQRLQELPTELHERVKPEYAISRKLADRLYDASLDGSKIHAFAVFCGETQNRWGDTISNLRLHTVIDAGFNEDPLYWEWICWGRFAQLLLDADWLDYDNKGSLASLKLVRLAYRTNVTGRLILQNMLEQAWKDKQEAAIKAQFSVPSVKVKYITDDKEVEDEDPQTHKPIYVTKAIRHTWFRKAKGLCLAHGKGFAAQQNLRIYLDSDVLDANNGEIRDYINALKEEQFKAKDDDKAQSYNKSLCNILESLGLRTVMQNWELNEAAYGEGIINGKGFLDGRERFYHSSDHIFTFVADRVFRALLEYYPGWKRTPRLILAAKIKLARNLPKIKNLPENEGVKKVDELLQQWKQNPPAMPMPPCDKNGKFVLARWAVVEFAEALSIWRIINALLQPDDEPWTVLVEWDAHASFAGLYGASCQYPSYLQDTNCVEADEDLPYRAFYAVTDALSRMDVKKGSQEAEWADEYSRGCAKLLYIPAHYAAQYQSTYFTANTVDHPVWGLIEKDGGGYLPKDIIGEMVEGGLNAYNSAKEASDPEYRKVPLTPLGDFIIRLMLELIEDLSKNPIISFIEMIKSTIGKCRTLEKEIPLGKKWGSIFMQTHHALKEEDPETGFEQPISTSRPKGFETVVYSDTREGDDRLWISSENDVENPEIYRGQARQDTYWLQTNRVGSWIPTGYVHHFDAVAADLLSFVCIKAFGYCLSIHDAFITSPEAYWLLNDIYGKILKWLWKNGPAMWASIFKSFGLTDQIVYGAMILFQGGDFPGGKCRTFK